MNPVIDQTVLLQAVEELALRQSMGVRDRFAHVHILRKSKESAEEQFTGDDYLEYRAHVVCSEMYVEYAAVFMAPVLVLCYSDVRESYDFGYDGGNPVRLDLLALSVGLQLFGEVIADLLCCQVEERMMQIPIRWGWKKANVWSIRFTLEHVAVFLSAVLLFLGGFMVNIPSQCPSQWVGTKVEYQYLCGNCTKYLKNEYHKHMCSRSLSV